MTAPMLSARSLGFGYGTKVVGRDVDVDVRSGEVLCLLGPNGSGKTTLFKTLLGLLPAMAGEVRLNGRPITRAGQARDRPARRLRAAGPRGPFSVSVSSTWS